MNRKAVIKRGAFLITLLALAGHSITPVANLHAGNVRQYIDGFGASTAWLPTRWWRKKENKFG